MRKVFTVIYSFKVKPEKHNEFEKAWRDLTILYRDFAGSLGSRLHKESDNVYVAYAQWPNKKSWEDSNEKLPDESGESRILMRDACTEIKVLHQLNVIDDLLVKNVC